MRNKKKKIREIERKSEKERFYMLHPSLIYEKEKVLTKNPITVSYQDINQSILSNKNDENKQSSTNDISDILNKKEVIFERIKQDLIKRGDEVVKKSLDYQPFLNKSNAIFNRSFLKRLFFSYQNYIMSFQILRNCYEQKGVDEKKILSSIRTTHTRLGFDVPIDILQIEYQIMINFVREQKSLFVENEIFPYNPINFLYNFLIFLFNHETERIKILQMENNDLYKEFNQRLIEAFSKFSLSLNQTIEKEMKENNEDSLTKRRIIYYICQVINN